MRDGYRHEALPYQGPEEFISSCVTLARDGLASNHRLIFLAAAAKLAEVRAELGADAAEISFVDTDEHGRNPSRITTLLDSFQATSNGRRALGVNELVVAGRRPAAFLEAQFAESVLNAASLQHWPLSLICLYDCATLDQDTVAEMRRSHPVVRGEPDNVAFDPDRARALFAAPLEEPTGQVEARDVGRTQLADVREQVRKFGIRADLPPDRVDDLVLAANEIVTNSLRYAGGRCRLALWQDEDSVVCEVRDAGVIDDPLVGRLAPPATSATGRGLWLANHLCDLVQIRSSHAGTVVRLHVDR